MNSDLKKPALFQTGYPEQSRDEEPMEIIVTKVLPAILGFIAGAIGSLVAPWVN
jgi:hypothetical protein